MTFTIRLGGGFSSDSLGKLMERLDEYEDSSGGWNPAVDIMENAEAVMLVADLAGVPLERVKVLIDGEVVRIYGERGPTGQLVGAHYHRMEIETGAFSRSFRITVPFDPSGVSAKRKDGLLYVTLPKKGSPRTRMVKVQSQ